MPSPDAQVCWPKLCHKWTYGNHLSGCQSCCLWYSGSLRQQMAESVALWLFGTTHCDTHTEVGSLRTVPHVANVQPLIYCIQQPCALFAPLPSTYRKIFNKLALKPLQHVTSPIRPHPPLPPTNTWLLSSFHHQDIVKMTIIFSCCHSCDSISRKSTNRDAIIASCDWACLRHRQLRRGPLHNEAARNLLHRILQQHHQPGCGGPLLRVG